MLRRQQVAEQKNEYPKFWNVKAWLKNLLLWIELTMYFQHQGYTDFELKNLLEIIVIQIVKMWTNDFQPLREIKHDKTNS